MKTEWIAQYQHTYRVFTRLVNDFAPEAWLHTGRGSITPARLSVHILQSTRYYMQESLPTLFASGLTFECDWAAVEEGSLPSQADVLACIEDLQRATLHWLMEMDLDAACSDFPWAGETKMGVVLFLLRHNLFHIGELSSLLNESKAGLAEDHYVKAIPENLAQA